MSEKKKVALELLNSEVTLKDSIVKVEVECLLTHPEEDVPKPQPSRLEEFCGWVKKGWNRRWF